MIDVKRELPSRLSVLQSNLDAHADTTDTRKILKNWPLQFATILCCVLGHPAIAIGPSSPKIPVYRLHFYHTHTRERLDIIYRRGDYYESDAQKRISEYLRDYRTGDIHQYDTRVLDLLHDLAESLGRPDAEIEVVCGYRTPQTNEYLRTHGHGVARRSLHMQAMAIDIRLRGVPAGTLRDAALALHRGGVGYYPASNFVHVDVGRVRQW